MAGLDSIAGVGQAAEQLFLWGVLQQVIGALLQPYLTQLQEDVWKENPLVPNTPAELASMLVRGHIDENAAQSEAALSGLNAERFNRLVKSYGNPPGPEALAEALRRKLIPPGQVGDEEPSYYGGIAQGDLQNRWADLLIALDKRLPGPAEAIDAAIRNIHTGGDPKALYSLFGGDDSFFQFMVDLTGQGPTPVEAGVLLNRGIIPEDNPDANQPSFAQAVRESRFKDKWTAAYAALRFYRPPPRTITAMIREGTLTADQAVQRLKDYGVQDADIPLYTQKATHPAVQKAHDITEGEIIRLYEEKGINADVARKHLTDIGYADTDIDLILAAADLSYQRTLTNNYISAIKHAYTLRHIDVNGAVTRLDALGIAAQYRDTLLQIWNLEIEVGIKQLTVKQVGDLYGAKILTSEEAIAKFEQIGYSNEDAVLLQALNQPELQPGSNTTSGLSNPGQ